MNDSRLNITDIMKKLPKSLIDQVMEAVDLAVLRFPKLEEKQERKNAFLKRMQDLQLSEEYNEWGNRLYENYEILREKIEKGNFSEQDFIIFKFPTKWTHFNLLAAAVSAYKVSRSGKVYVMELFLAVHGEKQLLQEAIYHNNLAVVELFLQEHPPEKGKAQDYPEHVLDALQRGQYSTSKYFLENTEIREQLFKEINSKNILFKHRFSPYVTHTEEILKLFLSYKEFNSWVAKDNWVLNDFLIKQKEFLKELLQQGNLRDFIILSNNATFKHFLTKSRLDEETIEIFLSCKDVKDLLKAGEGADELQHLMRKYLHEGKIDKAINTFFDFYLYSKNPNGFKGLSIEESRKISKKNLLIMATLRPKDEQKKLLEAFLRIDNPLGQLMQRKEKFFLSTNHYEKNIRACLDVLNKPTLNTVFFSQPGVANQTFEFQSEFHPL